MPLLKGASSDYTTFLKYNAQTLPAPAVKSASAGAVPRASIIGTLTTASAVAIKASPRTSVLKNYEAVVAAAAEVVASLYLPVSVLTDVFIVKYNTSGVAQWATTIGGTGSDTSSTLTTDSTDVYVSGFYTSTGVVTLNNNKTLPSSSTVRDGYIVKYNKSGVAQWANNIKGTGDNRVYGHSVNSTNVYAAGIYTSTEIVTLNNNKTLPITVGDRDGFIVKYDATTGLAQWANAISGTFADNLNAIATDSTGVYVSGVCSSSVTLNNGKTLTDSGLFIVKYDTDGLAQWANVFAGGIQVQAVFTDSTGVYICGQYTSAGVVTLNNNKTLPASAGDRDGFIVKYDTTTGFAQWAASIAGTGLDWPFTITTDSTGVYVSGQYTSTGVVTLNNNKILPASANAGSNDGFIIKYDASNGDALWATTIAGTGVDRGMYLTINSTGVYVSGIYTSTEIVTLNNNKTLPISVGNGAGGAAPFIVKYDTTTGLAQWANAIGGTGSPNGITADQSNVYLFGYYISAGVVTLNNNKTLPASGAGNYDGFIIKYDASNGDALWATTIAGTGSDSVAGIKTDATGVYVIGAYNSPTTPVLLTNGS